MNKISLTISQHQRLTKSLDINDYCASNETIVERHGGDIPDTFTIYYHGFIGDTVEWYKTSQGRYVVKRFSGSRWSEICVYDVIYVDGVYVDPPKITGCYPNDYFFVSSYRDLAFVWLAMAAFMTIPFCYCVLTNTFILYLETLLVFLIAAIIYAVLTVNDLSVLFKTNRHSCARLD